MVDVCDISCYVVNMPDSEYLTYDETARLLSVSKSTVLRMVAAGTLKVVRLTPRSPRIHRDAIVDFRTQALAGDQR